MKIDKSFIIKCSQGGLLISKDHPMFMKLWHITISMNSKAGTYPCFKDKDVISLQVPP